MLVLITTVGAQQNNTVEFSDTVLVLKFKNNDISSSLLTVDFVDLPDLLNNDLVVRLNENISKSISGVSEVEFGRNIIATTQEIEINFVHEGVETQLLEKTTPTSVWIHLKHVYSNWTFGTPSPPDNRGLGQGSLLDFMELGELLETKLNSVSDGRILAETILNLLLGANEDNQVTDWNGDGSSDTISDGFGVIEYTFGFRDHVVNAGAAKDAAKEVSDAADVIYNNMSNSIISPVSYSQFTDSNNLNTSSAELATIYQDALFMLENSNLTQLQITRKNLLNKVQNQIIPILFHNFNMFRNIAVGIETTINQTITLQDLMSPTTSETPVAFLYFPAMMLISFLKRKQTSTA